VDCAPLQSGRNQQNIFCPEFVLVDVVTTQRAVVSGSAHASLFTSVCPYTRDWSLLTCIQLAFTAVLENDVALVISCHRTVFAGPRTCRMSIIVR
jgi:hypothetical protein